AEPSTTPCERNDHDPPSPTETLGRGLRTGREGDRLPPFPRPTHARRGRAECPPERVPFPAPFPAVGGHQPQALPPAPDRPVPETPLGGVPEPPAGLPRRRAPRSGPAPRPVCDPGRRLPG